MPSGRTHDLLTYALAPPSLVVAQWFWGDFRLALFATAAVIFAGLMFGPDLDINSVQYKRWGPLRVIWSPYRLALAHRSRLSHGLLFSTIFRVLYFAVILLLLATVVLYLRNQYLLGIATTWTNEFQRVSDMLSAVWQKGNGGYIQAGIIGLWVGAAAHTILDVTASIGKLIWKAF